MRTLLLLLGITHILAGPICRCLSLAGGGDHGAYEAGVLSVLTNMSSPADIAWNAISGISVGSINTAGLAQFPMGQEIAAANYILGLWKSMNSSKDIYTEWTGGLVAGLLFHSGLYTTAPLAKLLKKDLIYPVARNFTLGSTDLDTGLFATFNESVGKNVIEAVMCSAAPPFVFPTQQFEGHTWADGACVMNLDVGSAIERCLALTEESNIISDIIYDTPYAGLANETTFKTMQVLSRVYHIISYDGTVHYTYSALHAYPNVTYRYVIHPSGSFPGGAIPLNFTPAVIDYEIQMGINDTMKLFQSQKTGRTIIEELFRENKGKIVYP